jgi:2-methylaconitate cis-trans-isomerase PrpF
MVAVVRIHNTNTRKLIVSRFPVRAGRAVVSGDLAIDGVAGTAAPIRLDFCNPDGAKTGRLLPSGNAVDVLWVPGLGVVRASLIDAANPCVFVTARDLGMSGTESPAAIERDAGLMERIEAVRRVGAVAMGLAADIETAGRLLSIPKLALLSAPVDSTLLSGRTMPAREIDILARMISVGQPHRAAPLTGALCLAVACSVNGSIANECVRQREPGAPVRVGHPSGSILVAAEVTESSDGYRVPAATVFRTARRLFQGDVLYAAVP